MNNPIDIAIKAKNFKCFGDNLQGFDSFYPINIIIGRNNSGKSALLDIIKYVTSPYNISDVGHKQKNPEVLLIKKLSEDEISQAFPQNVSGGMIPGKSHYEYGIKWLNKPITIRLTENKPNSFVNIDPPFDVDIKDYIDSLAARIQNPISGKKFKRLSADRDIKPEVDGQPVLEENGNGATNIIQNFINKSDLNSSLVEKDLLNALNDIFQPDSEFSDIVIQYHRSKGVWEIYLEETEKGRIAVSHSGSGLKTVILVLINIILMPNLEGIKLSDYIFAFEELENNLHPALQRRLLLYIQNIAKEKGCYFILTTHSNVIIDLFSKDKNTQIVHVTHNGKFATCKRVKTYIDNKGILDDLDIRASDLLQSNCIVWVEGPSDRLYFNKWINIWTNGQLKEGAHYQCIFYGGRLLAHLSANDEVKNEANGIEILRVNRNAIILIDSDRKSAEMDLNKTKKRIISEIESFSGLSWVTNGKEIENYIPISALKKYLTIDDIKELNPYEDIADYLKRIKNGEGTKYLNNKMLFAEKICSYLTKEMIEDSSDLKEKLDAVCEKIKSWNRI